MFESREDRTSLTFDRRLVVTDVKSSYWSLFANFASLTTMTVPSSSVARSTPPRRDVLKKVATFQVAD